MRKFTIGLVLVLTCTIGFTGLCFADAAVIDPSECEYSLRNDGGFGMLCPSFIMMIDDGTVSMDVKRSWVGMLLATEGLGGVITVYYTTESFWHVIDGIWKGDVAKK